MIECKIEQLLFETEAVWILSVPAAAAADVVVRFAALHLGKTGQIRFSDKTNGQTAIIRRKEQGFNLLLGDSAFPATEVWLEAIAAMLTDAALYGWKDTAHLDAEFVNGKESASVCFRIVPSNR